jgi:hypothetical protein
MIYNQFKLKLILKPIWWPGKQIGKIFKPNLRLWTQISRNIYNPVKNSLLISKGILFMNKMI